MILKDLMVWMIFIENQVKVLNVLFMVDKFLLENLSGIN